MKKYFYGIIFLTLVSCETRVKNTVKDYTMIYGVKPIILNIWEEKEHIRWYFMSFTGKDTLHKESILMKDTISYQTYPDGTYKSRCKKKFYINAIYMFSEKMSDGKMLVNISLDIHFKTCDNTNNFFVKEYFSIILDRFEPKNTGKVLKQKQKIVYGKPNYQYVIPIIVQHDSIVDMRLGKGISQEGHTFTIYYEIRPEDIE